MKEKQYIDSYDKMNVNTFLQLNEVAQAEATPQDKTISMVSILTGIDELDLLNLPLSDFNNLVRLTNFLQTEPRKKRISEKYVIEDTTLIPVFAIQDMTTAQFIDYQTYIKDADENIINLLAVFLVPENHKYNDGYDLNKVKELIGNNLSIEDALSLSAFFLSWSQALSKVMLNYLEHSMKKMKRKKMLTKEQEESIMKEIQTLRQNGVG